MRRFDAILEFLEARSAGRTMSAREVSDEHVFDFWREWAARELEIGVRLFASTSESFTLFVVLWSAAEITADESRIVDLDKRPTIGFSDELSSGDLDDDAHPALLLDLFEAGDVDEQVALFIETLERSSLKMVVATQLSRLKSLMAYPSAAENLHRTRVRSHSFDNAQRRAATASAKAFPRDEILAHVDADKITAYEEILNKVSVTLANIELALWGVVHILRENRDPEAVDVAVALSDAQTMQTVSRSVDRDPDEDIDEMFAGLREAVAAGLRHPALEALFHRAEAAFLKVKRDGFELARVREAPVAGAARMLAQSYRNQIALFRRRHAALCGRAPRTAFEEDVRLFRQAFADLYAPQE